MREYLRETMVMLHQPAGMVLKAMLALEVRKVSLASGAHKAREGTQACLASLVILVVKA